MSGTLKRTLFLIFELQTKHFLYFKNRTSKKFQIRLRIKSSNNTEIHIIHKPQRKSSCKIFYGSTPTFKMYINACTCPVVALFCFCISLILRKNKLKLSLSNQCSFIIDNDFLSLNNSWHVIFEDSYYDRLGILMFFSEKANNFLRISNSNWLSSAI